MQNQVLLLSGNRDAVRPWRCGVSIHSHTRHSQESLGFIARFLERRLTTRQWFTAQKEACQRITGITLDLDRAYWTPPLCERIAWEVESRQIEALGLRPMVSLTDHDRIDACTLLRTNPAQADLPISTEWTVPFGSAVFHFGVHNLPPQQANTLMEAMRWATEATDEEQVFALFAEMSRMPGVLLVFNHPLWNFFRIPAERFRFELKRFLASGNQYLHAFELNGMRSHAENRGVMRLAKEWGQVLISGGDRHGCEPNALLNLTNAADFPELVDEIREGRQSTVLIMPQYAEPLGWRLYQNFTHVIAEYPEHPEGRRRWDERTYHPDLSGEMAPMIQLWKNEAPGFLRTIFAAAKMVVRLPLQGLLRGSAGNQSESLLLPAVSRRAPEEDDRSRATADERLREASLEECLYASGEPAAD